MLSVWSRVWCSSNVSQGSPMSNKIARQKFELTPLVVFVTGCLITIANVGHAASVRPVLHIETETHLSHLQGVSGDSSGKYIVSSSDDGTVRLWAAATGQLVRT